MKDRKELVLLLIDLFPKDAIFWVAGEDEVELSLFLFRERVLLPVIGRFFEQRFSKEEQVGVTVVE